MKRNNKENEPGETSQKELVEIGQLLFPECYIDYESLVNSYHKDKNQFISENNYLLSNYDNFELNQLRPVELIYILETVKTSY